MRNSFQGQRSPATPPAERDLNPVILAECSDRVQPIERADIGHRDHRIVLAVIEQGFEGLSTCRDQHAGAQHRCS